MSLSHVLSSSFPQKGCRVAGGDSGYSRHPAGRPGLTAWAEWALRAFLAKGKGALGADIAAEQGGGIRARKGRPSRWPHTQGHSGRASTRCLHPELPRGHPEAELGASDSWHGHAKHGAQASDRRSAMPHAAKQQRCSNT